MKLLRKFPYWYLWAVPFLFIFLGIASNQSVLIANHGKFPVMLNEFQVAHFCSAGLNGEDAGLKFSIFDSSVDFSSCERGGQFLDEVHSIMGKNSHLKAMSDIFNLSDGIYSIGDFSLMAGFWMLTFTPFVWLVLTIRKLASLIVID